MGVFARLLRRSKATEEAPAAEAQADAPAPAQTEEAAGKGADGAGAGPAAQPAVTEAAGDAGSESVDIPQQQSAGKAADNEAGEGART
ncbi:hypothetical protein SUDANB58_04419 [Streptomyces sp. enrichment culture]|uniref:hypothetical protein n=1 Tax=Streptomyces sp. enrichment culture TaxID=1795815 RepID=UPI003F54B56C